MRNGIALHVVIGQHFLPLLGDDARIIVTQDAAELKLAGGNEHTNLAVDELIRHTKLEIVFAYPACTWEGQNLPVRQILRGVRK